MHSTTVTNVYKNYCLTIIW